MSIQNYVDSRFYKICIALFRNDKCLCRHTVCQRSKNEKRIIFFKEESNIFLQKQEGYMWTGLIITTFSSSTFSLTPIQITSGDQIRDSATHPRT